MTEQPPASHRSEIIGSAIAIAFGLFAIFGMLIEQNWLIWIGGLGFVGAMIFMIVTGDRTQTKPGDGAAIGLAGDGGCGGGGDGGGC